MISWLKLNATLSCLDKEPLEREKKEEKREKKPTNKNQETFPGWFISLDLFPIKLLSSPLLLALSFQPAFQVLFHSKHVLSSEGAFACSERNSNGLFMGPHHASREKRGRGGWGVLCAAGAQPVLVLCDCCGWQDRLSLGGQQDVYLSVPINSPGLPSTQCQGYVSVLGKQHKRPGSGNVTSRFTSGRH